jgi:diguanylate cyclase (GGDEF)-like protein
MGQNNRAKKVLICDDDRTHLLILNETLSALGYQIEQALNGEAALALFSSFRPDIILLDVDMPKLDGYSVCKQLRATSEAEDIPILMITGSDRHDSIEKAFEAGATDFLPKPIKWPLIRHRIKYMLRSAETQKGLKEREKELNYLAYFDGLTDLPNRQYFTRLLSTFIALSQRQQKSLAIMLLDLDNFKRINDTLGHRYGDIVLKEIAKRLAEQLRTSDVVAVDRKKEHKHKIARLGGDEFTILLSDCGTNDSIEKVAKRVINEISRPIIVEQYKLVVTASVGVAIYPIDGVRAEDLLKYADAAMYEAKDSGKNCYKFHSKELNERSLNRLKLEEHMREALVSNKFELFYQPQVNPSQDSILGAEALLRLHHETLGIISPLEFIPVAEDTGLIVELGYWVITQACEQLVKWQGTAANGIRISVNVSIKQINQPMFTQRLQEILQQTGVDPALLELELTESIIMNNPDENIVKLKEIKRLGVKLSIDDFGTGYSSLSYLQQFPLDTLKIDRSFISHLSDTSQSEDTAIVVAISAMAKALKLNVVVEGIETEEQLECVTRACIDDDMLVQGFFYSKAIPSKDFFEYVTAKKLSSQL